MFYKKRGQITIFIVVAILIVAGVALFFTISKGVNITGGEETKNPEAFIQNCLENKIEEGIELVSLQGGSVEPEHPYLYQGNEIEYHCYTNENFKGCGVQIPFPKKHIEEELLDYITLTVNNCFDSLKESFESRNYNINVKKQGDIKLDILPKRVLTTINYEVSMSKGDDYEKYESFDVVVNNNLYEMLAIVSDIIDFETMVGDADPMKYMSLYPDLKVEKIVRGDGTNIYILTDRNREDKFQFAVRSFVQSGGYLS